MVANIHYRWDFIGLSTDTKPTPASSEKVVDGSTYYCSDNSKLYVWYKDQWYEKTVSGGGGGTDYTAGEGIDITGTTISVDTDTIQPKLTAGSNITISDNTISATDTTYSNFTGTDGTAAGTAGLVPAPATTDAGKFLKADGTWDTAGGGGPTVVQTTGTSTTDVMSQNAVTSMVYADPITKRKVKLGVGASVGGNYSVALGADSEASTGAYSVALGAASKVTSSGEVSIGGSSLGTLGYNSSQYRLLTNVYDGQNAHDAATKGQLDAIAIKNAGAPTTATVGTVGQLLEDTTNGKLYICTAIVPGTDPDPDTYTWVEVGAGGGSGVIELTSADYNYPTDNPTSIALWLLEEGTYFVSNDGALVNVKMSTSRTDSVLAGLYEVTDFTENGQGRKQIEGFYNDNGVLSAMVEQVAANGTYLNGASLVSPPAVQTTGTSTTNVMSQNAVSGMVFDDPANRTRVRIASGATSTASQSLAIGANASATGDKSIALGGRAVSSEYVTASGNYATAIGGRATASAAIAIGGQASAVGSIALGNLSSATVQGEMNIGSSSTLYGYNSSNYRLLTGLYDPQSAHDAATKGYVDGLATMGTLSATPTGTTAGVPGRLYTYDTGGGSYEVYLCIHDNGDDTYVWKQVSLI